MTFDPPNNRPIFVNPIEDRLMCVACKDVLKDPVQSSCGHRLCIDCANAILKSPKPRCPDDGENLQSTGLFKDRFAAKEILSLECYCHKKSDGCNWKGTLADLSKHVCPLEQVNCVNEGCDAIVLRCQLARHVENDCSYREVECQFCLGKVIEINLCYHLEECPKFLIECDNKCGAKDIPREHMEEHILLECRLAIKYCIFHHLGCEFKGTNEQIEGHMNDYLIKHLEISGKFAEKSEHELQTLKQKIAVLEQRNRLLDGHVKAQNEALLNVRDTLITQQVKLKRVEEFMVNQNKIIEDLKKENWKVPDQPELPSVIKFVDELRGQLEIHSQKLKIVENLVSTTAEKPEKPRESSFRSGTGAPLNIQQRFDAEENTIAWQDVRLTEHDLRLSILEKASYDGTFVWKIENYSQRFQEASINKTPSLYSPPFYTARFGYKMCVRVYLNGDGCGKGTHISAFVSVMKGEYDAILPWPFSKKITIKLLDQNRMEDITETFRPDPNSSSCRRPRTEMNVASGCPKFCPHARLHTNGYVRENTIFVKIIIN